MLSLVMAEVNRQKPFPSSAAQCMGQRIYHMQKPGAVADGELAITTRVHAHPGFVFSSEISWFLHGTAMLFN